MNKEPRLHFTEEERGNSSLEKPIRKAEKAAKRAERAQEKIPKRKIRKTIVEPDTGKVSSKLVLEEKKKPPSKLTYGIQDTPGKIITGKAHKEIRESEQDNVGVESAHKSEEMLETGGRLLREGYRSHKLKPYRKAAQAERRLEKANLQVLYQKAYQDNPALSSNPLSRWQQRQAIKKQYIAAKRTRQTAGTAAKGVGKTAKSAGNVAGRTGQAADFVRKHKKGALLLLALFLLVCVLMSMVSSCSMMASSIGSVVSGSTYPSKDEALLGAEDAYAAMEAELQSYLDNYERTHSYDEYHFDLDEIKHDPYVLMSLLTAYYQKEWTLSDVEGLLDTLFDRQYILTEEVEVETRYDSEDDPYDYYICYVTLENFDLSHLPVYFLSEEQLSLYAMYMQTLGNRPDLFPQSEYPNASGREEYLDYDVPPEALEDETFAAMLAEAEKDLYEIRRASQSIFDRSVQRDAENLHKTGSRILAFLKENPERIRQARRFFLYYLDTAAKLLGRYRDFQNTGLHTEEIEEILERTKKALPMLNQAFEKQFTRLMEGELMDVEADIALLEKTLKMEGGK